MKNKDCTYTFTGEHPPFVINEFGSAVFMAMDEFKKQGLNDYVPKWKKYLQVKLENNSVIRGDIDPNYPYKTGKEERNAYEKNQKRLQGFVIQYLKEKYSDKNYAKMYIKQISSEK